jgi:hypothetical protein
MPKSTRSRRSGKLIKPEKPYRDSPLFPHATKRWAKEIFGRLHYFGPWSDAMGALQRYQEQHDDLHGRHSPVPIWGWCSRGGSPVRDGPTSRPAAGMGWKGSSRNALTAATGRDDAIWAKIKPR